MGAVIATPIETDGQSTPVQRNFPTPLRRPPKNPLFPPVVSLSQDIPSFLVPSRSTSKAVTLMDAPTHKDSSDQFRRLSRNFEAGEFALAAKDVDSDTSDLDQSDSNEEAEHKVRFIEVPGYGESSAEFRRKSHEFDRNEFAHVKEMPFLRLKKERSKTAVTKSTREGLMKAVKEDVLI